jgi:membrane protein required for colicin V production
MTSINWIDISALILVAYLCVRGFLQGLILSLFHYVSILGGALAVFSFREYGTQQLEGWNLSVFWSEVLAIVGIFLGAFLILQVLGWSLSKIIRPTPLGPIDKVGGTLFGGFKGISLLFLATYSLNTLPLPIHQWPFLQESRVHTWCSKGLPIVQTYWEQADKHIRSSYEKQKEYGGDGDPLTHEPSKRDEE